MPTFQSARLYACAMCHAQVVICSSCDRGNIYCNAACAQISRQNSLKEAGKRYQNTYQGKVAHARRQHRYREQQKKVTHQGSRQLTSSDLLSTGSENLSVKDVSSEQEDNEIYFCHFCASRCSKFLRNTFLSKAYRPKSIHLSAWPLGP
tara:strand:+ start:302 stop:748 length:447 start_codon:yes stop_codon:yes gene_type:complete